MESTDRPWTPEEAADWFAVSQVTIRRWVREGRLARIPTGGALRITALSVSRLTRGEYDAEHGEGQGARDDLGDCPVEGIETLARSDKAPDGVRCDCWRCGGREPDGTLHGADLHASYSPAPPHHLVQVTGSLDAHPGHVCFSSARYDGLRDWWDGLDDDEKREAYLVEKGNADALAASLGADRG